MGCFYLGELMADSGFNPYIVLLVGKSGTGKSSSLEGLKSPDKVLYLNCENGRALPFVSGFKEITITHPDQVLDLIEKSNTSDKFDTIVIDSLTYLMDMYESKVVLTATNKMQAWGEFGQFFKKIMHLVAQSNKQFIFTAHTFTHHNETEMVDETYVAVKGALAKNGIESYFSNVISAKKMSISKLSDYNSDLLTITEDEDELGIKHVLQTRLTKDTVNERIKSSKGLFTKEETFIDGNIQLVLDRLKTYYA